MASLNSFELEGLESVGFMSASPLATKSEDCESTAIKQIQSIPDSTTLQRSLLVL